MQDIVKASLAALSGGSSGGGSGGASSGGGGSGGGSSSSAGAAAVDTDLALLNLQLIADSGGKGVRLLAAKDTRKQLTSFAAGALAKPSSSAALAALKLLVTLASYARDVSKGIYQDLTFRPLTAFIRRATGQEALALACSLLLLLSRHTRKFAVAMRLEGGVEALCGVLASNPEAGLLSSACTLLVKVCGAPSLAAAGGPGSSGLATSNEANVKIALKKGAMRAVFQGLRQRSASARVSAQLMRLLVALCEGGGKPRVVLPVVEGADPEALALIVAVAKRHVDDPDVALAALSVINCLASDTGAAARLSRAGAFSVGWAAVVRHVASPAVMRLAMGAMWRLVGGMLSGSSSSGGGGAGAASGTDAASSSSLPPSFKPSMTVTSLPGSTLVFPLPAHLPPGLLATALGFAGAPPGAPSVLAASAYIAGPSAAGPGGAPPTTLTQWPVPHRYLHWVPSAFSSPHPTPLPRWAGAFVARPGYHPPVLTTPESFRIAYAVPQPKTTPAAGAGAARKGVASIGRQSGSASAAAAAPDSSKGESSSTATSVPPETEAPSGPAVGFFGVRGSQSMLAKVVMGGGGSGGGGVSPRDEAAAAALLGATGLSPEALAAVLDLDPATGGSGGAGLNVGQQLRLQIQALLDTDGLLRHRRPPVRSVSGGSGGAAGSVGGGEGGGSGDGDTATAAVSSTNSGGSTATANASSGVPDGEPDAATTLGSSSSSSGSAAVSRRRAASAAVRPSGAAPPPASTLLRYGSDESGGSLDSSFGDGNGGGGLSSGEWGGSGGASGAFALGGAASSSAAASEDEEAASSLTAAAGISLSGAVAAAGTVTVAHGARGKAVPVLPLARPPSMRNVLVAAPLAGEAAEGGEGSGAGSSTSALAKAAAALAGADAAAGGAAGSGTWGTGTTSPVASAPLLPPSSSRLSLLRKLQQGVPSMSLMANGGLPTAIGPLLGEGGSGSGGGGGGRGASPRRGDTGPAPSPSGGLLLRPPPTARMRPSSSGGSGPLSLPPIGVAAPLGSGRGEDEEGSVAGPGKASGRLARGRPSAAVASALLSGSRSASPPPETAATLLVPATGRSAASATSASGLPSPGFVPLFSPGSAFGSTTTAASSSSSSSLPPILLSPSRPFDLGGGRGSAGVAQLLDAGEDDADQLSPRLAVEAVDAVPPSGGGGGYASQEEGDEADDGDDDDDDEEEGDDEDEEDEGAAGTDDEGPLAVAAGGAAGGAGSTGDGSKAGTKKKKKKTASSKKGSSSGDGKKKKKKKGSKKEKDGGAGGSKAAPAPAPAPAATSGAAASSGASSKPRARSRSAAPASKKAPKEGAPTTAAPSSPTPSSKPRSLSSVAAAVVAAQRLSGKRGGAATTAAAEETAATAAEAAPAPGEAEEEGVEGGDGSAGAAAATSTTAGKRSSARLTRANSASAFTVTFGTGKDTSADGVVVLTTGGAGGGSSKAGKSSGGVVALDAAAAANAAASAVASAGVTASASSGGLAPALAPPAHLAATSVEPALGEKTVFRSAAFLAAREWLAAPHWFPELQMSAFLLWELAPLRAVLWRAISSHIAAVAAAAASAGEGDTSSSPYPCPLPGLHGDDKAFNAAVAALIEDTLDRLRGGLLGVGGGGGGLDSPQADLGLADGGLSAMRGVYDEPSQPLSSQLIADPASEASHEGEPVFPARGIRPLPPDPVLLLPAPTASPLHPANLTRLLRDASVGFTRAITSTGPYALDERRLWDRRLPVSRPLEATAFTADFSCVSPPARAALAASLAARGLTLEAVKPRSARVYVTPSGMVSARRLVVPPSHLPTAFHAAPPLALTPRVPAVVVGVTPGTAAPPPSNTTSNDDDTASSSPPAPGLSLSLVLSRTPADLDLVPGYVFFPRTNRWARDQVAAAATADAHALVPVTSLFASSASRFPSGYRAGGLAFGPSTFADLTALPEPLFTPSPALRLGLIGRLMLRTIAHVGVCSGQLMRHRFTGGHRGRGGAGAGGGADGEVAAGASDATTTASAPSDAITPPSAAVPDTALAESAALAPLLMEVLSRPIYHRYADQLPVHSGGMQLHSGPRVAVALQATSATGGVCVPTATPQALVVRLPPPEGTTTASTGRGRAASTAAAPLGSPSKAPAPALSSSSSKTPPPLLSEVVLTSFPFSPAEVAAPRVPIPPPFLGVAVPTVQPALPREEEEEDEEEDDEEEEDGEEEDGDDEEVEDEEDEEEEDEDDGGSSSGGSDDDEGDEEGDDASGEEEGSDGDEEGGSSAAAAGAPPRPTALLLLAKPTDASQRLDRLPVSAVLSQPLPPPTLEELLGGEEDDGDDDSQGSDEGGDELAPAAAAGGGAGKPGAGGGGGASGEGKDDGEEEEEEALPAGEDADALRAMQKQEGGDSGETDEAARLESLASVSPRLRRILLGRRDGSSGGGAGGGADELADVAATLGSVSSQVDAATRATLVSAVRGHLDRIRAHQASITGSLSKRDVMKLLSEAADEVQACVVQLYGRSALSDIATVVAGAAPSSGAGGGGSGEGGEGVASAPVPTTPLRPSGGPASVPPASASAAAAFGWGRRQEALARTPPLDFESRFESGNLCAATRTGALSYELTLDPDVNTGGHTQWFFFRVRGMVAEDGSLTRITPAGKVVTEQCVELGRGGVGAGGGGGASSPPGYRLLDTSADVPPLAYTFHIVNLEKSGSSFNDGMRPLVYYQSAAPGGGGGGGGGAEPPPSPPPRGSSGSLPSSPAATAAVPPPSSSRLPSIPTPSPSSDPLYLPGACTSHASFVPPLPGDGWRRAGFHIVYYRNQYARAKVKAPVPLSHDETDETPLGGGSSSGGSSSGDSGGGLGGGGGGALVTAPPSRPAAQYSETWTIAFPPGVHTVFFAYCYPYTYTDLRRDVARWERRALRCAAWEAGLARAAAAAAAAGGASRSTSGGSSGSDDAGESGAGVDGSASPSAAAAATGVLTTATPSAAPLTLLGEQNELEVGAAVHLPAAFRVPPAPGVPIREWDEQAATGNDFDALGRDLAPPSSGEGGTGNGGWAEAALPFAPPPGALSPEQPLGTAAFSGILHRGILCHSLAGNPLPLLTITDFSSGPVALAARPYVILSGRVHPGETNASWMLRGVLDFLTSTAPAAVELRQRVVFKVVPFLNPDGVVNGHHRTNLAGLDLNRHWSTPDLARAPEIWHLRRLILTLQSRAAGLALLGEAVKAAPLGMDDLAHHDVTPYLLQMVAQAQAAATAAAGGGAGGSSSGGSAASAVPLLPPPPTAVPILPPLSQPVLFYCDFHGHSRRPNVFTFGCHEYTAGGAPPVPGETHIPDTPPSGPSPRLFPKLLASRVDTFLYSSCTYKVQKEKANCARVAMWRDACLSDAYTIEASFSGPDQGARTGTHFNTHTYEEVGHAFCLALLDWLQGSKGPRAAEALGRITGAKGGSGGAAAGGGGAGVEATTAATAAPVSGPAKAASGGGGSKKKTKKKSTKKGSSGGAKASGSSSSKKGSGSGKATAAAPSASSGGGGAGKPAKPKSSSSSSSKGGSSSKSASATGGKAGSGKKKKKSGAGASSGGKAKKGGGGK